MDYDAMARLIERQIEAGIHFLVPLGTTGETPCLTDEEKIKVLRLTKEHCHGRPVVVGAGTNSLAGTISNIKLLEPYGPDAFLIVAPYYNKPTQRGLYEYFKAVAASTGKDIILYNVPGRTGVNIEAETTLRLAEEVENIVAVKEASGKYAQISEIIRRRPEGFSVLSGNDDETLPLMATGADGVISVVSNVDPWRMVKLVESLGSASATGPGYRPCQSSGLASVSGFVADQSEVKPVSESCLGQGEVKTDSENVSGQVDIKAARELHHKLMPIFKACFVESNPIPAKAALAQLGLISNILRLPLTPASQATEELMRRTLADLFA